jgi:hypothetical protein
MTDNNTAVVKATPKIITVEAMRQLKERKGEEMAKAKVVPMTLGTDGAGNYTLTVPACFEEGTVKLGTSGKTFSAYLTTGQLGEAAGNVTVLDSDGKPGISLAFNSIALNLILRFE